METKIARLGDFCSFRAGSSFPEKYQGKSLGDFPFIKVSDMKLEKNQYKIHIANNWLDGDEAKKINAKPVPSGAVVFAKIGLGLFNNRMRLTTMPTLLDNNMMAAIPHEGVSSELLYSIMNTLDMETWAIGAALPYIRGVDLEKIKLDHLDKGGLIKASKVENEINHLIDLLVTQSNRLDDYTSAIFRSWFIDFEPIIAKEKEKSPFGMSDEVAALFPNCFEVTSELGNIPVGWKVKNLTEICEIQRGFSYSGDSLCEREKGVAMVNLASFIEGGGYKHSGIKYISSEFKEKFFIKKGDVLIATVDLTPGLRVVGSPLIPPSFLEDNSIFSQDLLRLRNSGKAYLGRGFLYHWLKIQRRVLKQWSSGTTVSRFPISALDKYPILVPTENILQQFELIFERNRKLMELISMKIRDLVYTKNTLIPKLMLIEDEGLA